MRSLNKPLMKVTGCRGQRLFFTSLYVKPHSPSPLDDYTTGAFYSILFPMWSDEVVGGFWEKQLKVETTMRREQ